VFRRNDESIPAGRVAELFAYDAESGALSWKLDRGKAKAGAKAGYVSKLGYVCVGIEGRNYFAHRLAWAATHGRWPNGQIDHINGNKSDNRLCNLREADAAQNQQNIRTAKRRKAGNDSGFLGVFKHKRSSRWQAQIAHKGKTIYLGMHDTPEMAHSAYLAAKRQIHSYCTI